MNKKITSPQILLIGSGRIAKQIISVLDQQHISYENWNRNDLSSSVRTLKKFSHILLAVSDRSIQSLYDALKKEADPSVIWVHFSGALSFDAIWSAHPLASITQSPIPYNEFKKILFTLSSPLKFDMYDNFKLTDILPGFNNNFVVLPNSAKPLYHALCVAGGNLPALIWKECLRLQKELPIPESYFHQFWRQSLENFILDGSITGPIVRNDTITIEKNVQTLPDGYVKDCYQLIAKTFSNSFEKSNS